MSYIGRKKVVAFFVLQRKEDNTGKLTSVCIRRPYRGIMNNEDLGNKLVLAMFISDDYLFRSQLSKSLKETGLFSDIIETDTGKNCLEIYKKQKPNIIMMDVDMLILNGTEIIKTMKNYHKAHNNTKIVILVNLLLIIQKILNEFGLIKWILMPFTPLLKVMGLPSSTGFLWVVANTLGLGYGGAIMISETEDGKLSREDADLLNHNIAISHSQLEDPLLFVAVGYPLGILIWPRVLLAIVFVWLRRFEIWARK